MKKLLFVSAGRCGTTRIAQILRQHLPDNFAVQHQMPYSRLANIVGNLLYYFNTGERVKEVFYEFITSRFCRNKNFICTDPLTAMIIPRRVILSQDVGIVHIIREPQDFAESFLRFSHSRFKSLIAHNLIPFWQLGIWPLENVLNKNIKKKYRKIEMDKTRFFREICAPNPNYVEIKMQDIFNSNFLQKILLQFFNYNVVISQETLKIKAN